MLCCVTLSGIKFHISVHNTQKLESKALVVLKNSSKLNLNKTPIIVVEQLETEID